MRLLKILRQNKTVGFTLLEGLLVVGILLVIFAAGLPVAVNFYQAYQFDSEYELMFSLLEQARNQAMANVNEANHGLSINNVNFVLFQGASFAARDTSKDKSFPRNNTVTISTPTELVFAALDGTVASTTFTLTNASDTKTRNLYVNPEGLVYRQ